MVILRVLKVCMVLVLLLPLAVKAELVVEVTQGVSEPTPVAVVPFKVMGSQIPSDDIAQVIDDDLSNSGLFETLPRGSMLSLPSGEAEVFFRDWRMVKTDFLVTGTISASEDGRANLRFQLWDILKESKLIDEGVDFILDRQERDLAHYVSDMVYEKLTGVRGAFRTRIAYVTAEALGGQEYRYRIEVADWDGKRAQALLTSDEPIMSPSWSSDGKKLAYVSFQDRKPAIYIQEITSDKQFRVQPFDGINGAPAWSPDDQQLALVLSRDGNPEIYVLDLNTADLQRVTNHYGIDTEPSWSPDGSSIIFTSDRGGSPQIYKLDLATRQLSRLTYEGNYNARGSLTPDGRFLAMIHRSAGSGNKFSVAVQDLKTDRLDILTETGLEESPSIAPNASVVLYATQKGTQGVLSAVSLDGFVRFDLPLRQGRLDVREPAWGPFID